MSRLIDDQRRYTSDLIAELSDEIEYFKANLAKEVESRDGWKDAWKKSEAEIDTLKAALSVAMNENQRLTKLLEESDDAH